MMKRCLIPLVAIAILSAFLPLSTASGQGNPNTWLPLGLDDYATPSNWDAGGVPQLSYEERAVINNGGTAFLDVATVPTAGGLEVTNGTLEIRRGGTLDTGIGFSADGTLTLGPSGNLTLGGLTGSSAANLTVAAGATLQGAVSVLGPNVNFSAASMALSGSLHTTVTTGGSSALKSSGSAALSGPLQLTFDGVTPTAGHSWSIVDAASISGSFTQVTSNATLNPGYYFVQNMVAGGTNGAVAQIAVEAQLILEVNRRSGQASIKNLTASESISIDGYQVVSPSGMLVTAQWNSFHDNGFSSFEESNPSSIHLGELSLTGSRSIGSGSSASLGNIFTTNAPLSPAIDGDLTFDYHKTGGSTRTGEVDYVGPHNNMVLVVNPNGQTFLQNQSTMALDIDGYLITSASGSLDLSGWSSLADGNAAWSESNPSTSHLSELMLSGSQHFGAESAAIAIGSAFTVGGTKDLEFQFHVAGAGTYTGIVEYEDGVFNFGTVPGDFNGNGTVDAADYVVWRNNQGTMNTLPNDNGIGGTIGTAHYNLWRANFGAIVGGGSSAALVTTGVPEPATSLLLLTPIAAMCFLLGRSRLAASCDA